MVYLVSSARPSWEGGSCSRHLNQAWITFPSKCAVSMAVIASGQGKMWHRNRQQKLQETRNTKEVFFFFIESYHCLTEKHGANGVPIRDDVIETSNLAFVGCLQLHMLPL